MADLKLMALDAEDLSVISAHLQDAVVKVADLAYLPHEKRFAALLNRFDWVDAVKDGSRNFARRRAALRFDRVLSAQLSGIALRDKSKVLSLLAIGFEAREAPEGDVTLVFADNGAIRLRVECIEVEMKDLGPAWEAKSMPRHPDDPAEP